MLLIQFLKVIDTNSNAPVFDQDEYVGTIVTNNIGTVQILTVSVSYSVVIRFSFILSIFNLGYRYRYYQPRQIAIFY